MMQIHSVIGRQEWKFSGKYEQNSSVDRDIQL